MSLGSILLSVVSGGATGILGGAIQSVFGFLSKKQELKAKELDHKFQIDLVKANSEVMAQEWAQRTELAKVEGETSKYVADSNAFAEGWKNDEMNKLLSSKVKPTEAQGWLLIGLDAFKSILRPGMTIYLSVIATMMYLEARGLIAMYGKAMNINQAVEIHTAVTGTILYLFTTAVSWWFYGRAGQMPTKK